MLWKMNLLEIMAADKKRGGKTIPPTFEICDVMSNSIAKRNALENERWFDERQFKEP